MIWLNSFALSWSADGFNPTYQAGAAMNVGQTQMDWLMFRYLSLDWDLFPSMTVAFLYIGTASSRRL